MPKWIFRSKSPKCGGKMHLTDHLLLKKANYEDEIEIWNNIRAPNFWFHVEPTLGWPCCFDRIRRVLLTQGSSNLFCLLLFFYFSAHLHPQT